MAAKKKKDTVDRALEGLETASSVVGSYLEHRYKLEEKVDDIKEQAEDKVDELKKDAVHSAYEVKKGFMRAVIEILLLSTSILALVIGGIVLVSRAVSLEYVLLGYGLIVSIIVLAKMKLE